MRYYMVARDLARWRRLAVLGAVLALAVACASLPAKQRAVQGLQAAHTAVGAAQDAERALYAAGTAGLTAERHGAFAGFFERYFQAEQRAVVALKAWRAGDPPPASLREALAVLDEALATAQQVVAGSPPGSVGAHIAQGVAEVQKVLDALGGGQ